MTLYLLDTNTISDLAKKGQESLAWHDIARYGQSNIITSVLVEAEIMFGLRKRNATTLSQRVQAVLSIIAVHPINGSFSTTYAFVRDTLEKAGTPIGALDTLIASHCLDIAKQQPCIMVTNNTREFNRVPGLVVQNWI